jgi:glutamyl endopeptidase
MKRTAGKQSSKPTKSRGGAAKTAEGTPSGLHTPISNIAVETVALARRMLSPPTTGQAPGLHEAQSDDTELLRAELEAAVEIKAPKATLHDIGRASFGEREVQLETVHGPDNRIQVTQTDQYPYRVNASLLITARDGSQWIGTAWFISARTLITAGHCVYITNSGVPNRDGWVKTIQVMPGRNGSKLPFGSATSSRFWTVKGWADSGDENYDYGAIVIPTPLGDTVGTLGYAAYADSELTDVVANVTGYPGDKPAGTLWYDTKNLASVTPTKVFYDIDTAGGQSGAAVYVIKSGQRIAVAVHAYGGAVTNSGTRIAAPVYQNLTNWKA